MPVARIEDVADITIRRSALERRLSLQHKIMRDCDDWHTRNESRLLASIWRNVKENVRRHTVVSLVPQAIKNSCVAFTASKQPKITATPINVLSAPELSTANFSERIGYAIWYTLNRHRQFPLNAETADYGYGRAIMIARACWLKPEQRGDTRIAHPLPPEQPALPFSSEEPAPVEPAPEEQDVLYQTVEQGEFPVLVQLYDPLDCLWSLSRDGSTREFMHISTMTWDDIIDLYPDIVDMDKWRGKNDVASLDNQVEVIDYWDDEVNAIVVGMDFYKKPTKHGYPYCPVVIELANTRPVRDSNTPGGVSQQVAVPITWDILPAAADHSHTLSITGTYVEYGVFQTYVHQGIDPSDSPYMQVVGDGEQPEYVNNLKLEPGGIIPAFKQEQIRPLEPAPINNQLVFYQQQMESQMALSGFHTNFLTGVTPAGGPDSGYGIVQQRIATTAKMTRTTIAIDRFLSRLMTLIKDIIVAEWDYDAEMVLTDLMGQGRQSVETEMQVTKETFQVVREISVQVVPEVPLNDEQEKQAVFQANGQFLMSDYRAIEKLAWADDPEEEQNRIAAERVAKEDPTFGPPIRLAQAAKWMKQNGYEDVAANIAQAAAAMSQMAMQSLMPQPQQPTQPSPSLPSPGGGGVAPVAPQPGQSAPPLGVGPGMDPNMAQMNGSGGIPPDMAMMQGAMPQ